VTWFWARNPMNFGSFFGSGENFYLLQNTQTGYGDHPAANSAIAIGFPPD